jgi:hypothetical protein
MQSGEPNASCSGYSPYRSLWFSVQLSSTRTILADTIGSGIGTYLAVWKGSSLGSLTQYDCTAATAEKGDETSALAFRAVKDVRYSIQVFPPHDSDVTDSKIRFHLAAVTPPANDTVATARVVTALPFRASFSNRNATNHDEPSKPPVCTSNQSSVWFRYSPSTIQNVQIDTLQSDYATAVTVYRGTSLGGLTRIMCTWQSWGGYDGTQTISTFRAVPGETYSIRVGGNYGASGTTALVIRAVTPPANDAFAAAQDLGTGVYQRNAYTRDATFQAGEPTPSCVSRIGATRWYRFTPTIDNPDSGAHWNGHISTPAQLFVAVYAGASLGSLTEVACFRSTQAIDLTGLTGQTYRVQVGGDLGDSGPARLRLYQLP